MCQQTATSHEQASTGALAGPFPWDAGVFDAHCHPTDTMASIKDIRRMKARALAVMATRSQDQELVAEVAQSHSIGDAASLQAPPPSPAAELSAASPSSAAGKKHVIPAFGWHPWFSHQLYDDSSDAAARKGGPGSADAKKTHYAAVLQPDCSHDDDFVSHLPDPRPLSSLLGDMRKNLEKHPAAMVGEIGLDKAFRLPNTGPVPAEIPKQEGLTPGGREGRRLSPYRVKMDHQVAILKTQLALAGELGRPVSIHGVQAHGVLHDTIASTWRGHEKEVVSKRQLRRVAPGAEDWSSSEDEEEDDLVWNEDGTPIVKPRLSKAGESKSRTSLPYPPRICLHSYSGPSQMARQYLHPSIPAEIYFSFSACINLAGQDQVEKTKAVLEAIPDDKILLESDLHTAGQQMDSALEEVYRFVCEVKGWELKDGVERIGKNFARFVFG